MNRNILFYGGATGVAQIFSFLALFAYTAMLKPEMYALVAIFETVILLLQSCISGAIDRSSQRFYLELEPDKVISTSASIAIAGALLLFPLTIAGTMLSSQVTLFEFVIIYVTAVSYVLHTIVIVKYQFAQRPMDYFLATVAKSLSFLIGSIFFLYVLKMQAQSFLYASLTSALILLVISICVTKPKLSALGDKALVKEMLSYSLPFVPTLLASWFITWSVRFFMVGHIQAQDIGVFSAAQKVAMVFFIFTQTVTLVATPALFRLLKDGKEEQAKNNMLLSIKALMIVALGITFFLPDILRLVMSDEYQNIQGYITILMYVNFIAAILGVSSSILFSYYKKTALQMKVFLFIALVSITLNSTLIPIFKMHGLVFSLLIPITLLIFLHFYIVKTQLSFSGLGSKVMAIAAIFSILLLVSYYLKELGTGKSFVLLYEFGIILTLGFWTYKSRKVA
ncbi:lipopolysaccharide biosynthesis protein [Paraperlucidibaca wandonensis]|uniref:Lipopolysaccharide biosynthesis protein n=1 Tax=Paraperlucidibaca wandonensis TaxID=1268273 RepID=A0ABW3HFN9_9GAMM